MANKKKEEQTGYQFQRQSQLDDITDKILNREKFSYDLNGDAFYNQYKDKFVQQGKMAMKDTMGQAAALTGGYGSSYAQQVGQQAYQGYLQGLNDVVPELYQLALDSYSREGEELYKQYGLLTDQDALGYGRYRDGVADQQWQQQFNYQQARDAAADAQWKQQFDYQQSRDQAADAQWLKEFEESKRQYERSLAAKAAGTSGAAGYYDDSKPVSRTGNTTNTFTPISGDGNGGGLPDPTETDNTKKFVASHMTLEQALSRGITKKEYTAMVESWINNANLTEGEVVWLMQKYGLKL